MSDTFKVRVVKAGSKSYWYANKIGHVFDVNSCSSGYRCAGADIDGRNAHSFYIDESDCVIVEDFKVGDRVRVKPECVGKQQRVDDGGCGTITNKGTIYDWQVHLDSQKEGRRWWYDSHELTLLEDTMEYTVNGKTYKQLKDITVKELILAHASDNDIYELSKGNRPLDDIGLIEAIDYASSCNEKLQWLVDNGFVEVVKPTMEMEVGGSGVAFKINGDWVVDASMLLTSGRLRVRLSEFDYNVDSEFLSIKRK